MITHGSSRRARRPVLILAALALLSPMEVRGEEDRAVVTTPRAATGRLSGTITVGPGLSSRKMRFQLYPDSVQPASSRTDPAPADESGNVVVYLEGLTGTPGPDAGTGAVTAMLTSSGGSAPAAGTEIPAPVMRQEGLTFHPHLLTILKGTTVEFPNADPIFHNVFSLSRASSFDLGRYPQGASRSVRFEKPGVVKVFCHIHSDMNAVIFVLDNPFFARPDADGRYRISGVPPGEYRVVAWHERARPLSRSVRIEPGRDAILDFSIPLMEPQDGD